MKAMLAIVRRDLTLSLRAGSDVLTSLVFFILVAVIVPFAIGPDRTLLSQLAPAIVWIAALLSSLIGLERLFGPDAEDGTLDLYRLSGLPLAAVVLAKMLVQLLVGAVPLLLATPLLAVLLAIDGPALLAMLVSLLVGLPGLVALGAMGAGITASLRRGGMIAPVLVLPLAVPIVIFGVGAVPAGPGPDQSVPALLFLSATSLLLFVIAPFAAGLAIAAGED